MPSVFIAVLATGVMSLGVGDAEPQFLVTELSPLHRQIIRLLGLSPDNYGR